MLGSIMMAKVVASGARHFMTAAGGALIAAGYADAETWQAVQGGGVALVGILWAIVDKKT